MINDTNDHHQLNLAQVSTAALAGSSGKGNLEVNFNVVQSF